MDEVNNIYMVIIMALPLSYPHLYIVDLVHIADMDESYGTYVDDEYFDTHDYADDTDDDTDDDIDDDTGDVVGPWSMSNSGGLRVHSVGDKLSLS